jgi:PBP1b-binding outer membrane lipoprotein LpoB
LQESKRRVFLHPQKLKPQMKKVFAIAFIAVAFAACNNEAENTVSAEDSARIADSVARVQADSIAAAQKMAADSLGAKVDSANLKLDSVNTKVDSLKK